MKTRIRESIENGQKKYICEYKVFFFWKSCNQGVYAPYGIRSYSSGYSTRAAAEKRIKEFNKLFKIHGV